MTYLRFRTLSLTVLPLTLLLGACSSSAKPQWSGPSPGGSGAAPVPSATTPAGQAVRVTSFLGDGQTVGVGMPLIIRFGRAVPERFRSGVVEHLSVRATPAQE